MKPLGIAFLLGLMWVQSICGQTLEYSNACLKTFRISDLSNITMTVTEKIEIYSNNKQLTISVVYENATISGDLNYRGFNMQNWLFPNRYEFRGDLKRNGTYLKELSQPYAGFFYDYTYSGGTYYDTVGQSTSASKSTNRYIFTITNVTFSYDYTARNAYDERVRMINNYYGAYDDLNRIGERLNYINPEAFEVAEQTQRSLDEMKREIDQIVNAGFWQGLKIESNDPQGLYSRLYQLRTQFNNLQERLNQTFSVIQVLCYDKALVLYSSGYINDAMVSLDRSLYYSPNFPPSLLLKAQILFETYRIDESKELLRRLFALSYVDAGTHSAANILAYQVEWYDINIAAGLLTQNEYERSLTAVQAADDFCSALIDFQCSDTIELIRTACHQGIYHDFLINADVMRSQSFLDEADAEVVRALEYQQKFSKYIVNMEEALALQQQIRIELYDVSIQKGNQLMKDLEYRSALLQYNKARNLEDYYPVNKNPQLWEFIRQAKLQVMLLDLSVAENNVAENDLESARSILIRIIEEQKQYGWLQQEELSRAIEHLKNTIFAKVCENAKNEYQLKIDNAIGASRSLDYILAAQCYQEAINVAVSHHDCKINDERAQEGQELVRLPAEYQQQKRQCVVLINNHRYQDAIDTYLKMGEFFSTHQLQSFSLVHDSLINYVIRQDEGFLLYGVSYFVSKQELEKAFALLQELKNDDVNNMRCKDQQSMLGRAFAERDFHNDPSIKPGKKVVTYTMRDSWYSHFKKQYLLTFKLLKKEAKD